ncbi:hypothetical protein KQH61_05800 [bacterium]|nr:hypothetical protein [bacterium]MCB2179417.1 hypothetical protein [bacterium]
MASWIVHLRIAEKLLEKIPGLDAAQFAIGHVAPDSGVLAENRETFDPPYHLTHFTAEGPSGSRKILEDLRFYREFIQDKVSLKDDVKQYSFLWGYFMHLVTDNLWAERIAEPTKKEYAKEFADNPDFIWEVKKDWYGLDFTYVRAHPDSLFWRVFLEAEYELPYLYFFPMDAIPNQLDYIKKFYQRTDPAVKEQLRLTENTYLNEAEMALFVDGAYRDLLRLYQMIIGGEVDVSGLDSAVAIIS